MTNRAVISGTGVAVLSLILLFARQMMIYLQQLPRHVGILYDVVLVTVWLAHLAQLVQSVAASVSPPASASASTAATTNPIDDGTVLNSDGTVVPCWAARGVAIGAVAVGVYTTRLVLDILQACSRLCSGRDRMVLLESGRSKIGTDAEMCATAARGEGRGYGYSERYRDDEGAPQAMAYSPVLAFFPAD